MRRLVVLLALVLLAPACRSGAAKEELPPAPVAGHPLAGWAERLVLVAPVQRVLVDDSLGWGRQLGPARSWLDGLDAELVAAFRERGIDRRWILVDSTVARARRNAAYAGDPRALEAPALADPPKANGLVPAAPAQRIRALASLTGNAPWLLVPASVRFVRAEEGKTGGRAVMALSLVDVRGARVVWHGRVRSDVAERPGPAVSASLAERVADLVAPVP